MGGRGEAEAIPGRREFIAARRRLGHTVFYVSNRDCASPPPTSTDPCPAKSATMRNLVALGIDPRPIRHRMLLRGERPEWNTAQVPAPRVHRR
jgi:predicted secreted acid phosphatase